MDDALRGKNEREDQSASIDADTFLDLNFVPQWARRPPDAIHAARFRERGGEDRAGRAHGGDRGRGGFERRSHGAGGDVGKVKRRSVSPQEQSDRPRMDRKRTDHTLDMDMDVARPFRVAADTPPSVALHAQFLPERKAVFALRKRIAASHKAYPLLDLAALLLAREGMCYVRLALADSDHAQVLHQCQICRTVALDPEALATHIVDDHLEAYFTIETETVPAPSGVFVCVAICGLSGTLLGPPNHHRYAEAVKALHSDAFAHMDFERYRSKIRISHEPADVERWKAECTARTVYRRNDVDAEVSEPFSLKDAQRFMRENVVDTSCKRLRRVVLREAEAHTVQDPAVRVALHRAWQREVKFPIQVALALRAALRSRDLHIFKAGGGKGMHFVTSVKPSALDPETTVPAIHDALRYLEAHPGCTRSEMLHDLVGTEASDDPRAKALLQPISWLTEKGHIIEFFNGRLAVPR